MASSNGKPSLSSSSSGKPMGLPGPQIRLSDAMTKLRDPKDGLPVENRAHHFRIYKKSFLGKDLVTFLKEAYGVSRTEAFEIAMQLYNAKHFQSLMGDDTLEDKTHFYRFQADEEAIQKKKQAKSGKKKPVSTWTGVINILLKSIKKVDAATTTAGQGTKHYKLIVAFGDQRIETLATCSYKFHQKFSFPILKDVPEWKMNFTLLDDGAQLAIGNLNVSPFFDVSLNKQETQIVLSPKDGEDGSSFNLLIDISASTPLTEAQSKLVPYYGFDEVFSNLLVVSAISEAIESPESPINVSKTQSKLYVGAIVDICTRLDKITDLLQYTIHREVARTPSEQLLFRSDNVASHIQTVVLQNTGGIEYLNAVLKETIQDVLNDPDKFEIDAVASSLPEAIVADNQLSLKRAVQTLLDKVLTSDALLPSSMRTTIRLLYNTVERYFPGNGPQAASGMLFLRFLCPALVSPNTWGLLEDAPPPAAKRALLLITKIFQALANNVKVFKEPYMESFNSFLVSSDGKIHSFLNKIQSGTDNNTKLRGFTQSENILLCYQALHVFLHENRSYLSILLVDEEKRYEAEHDKRRRKSKDKGKDKSKDKRKKKKKEQPEKKGDGVATGVSSSTLIGTTSLNLSDTPSRHSVHVSSPPTSARLSLKHYASTSALRAHQSHSNGSVYLSSSSSSASRPPSAALTVIALSDVLVNLSLYPPTLVKKEDKDDKEKHFLPAQLRKSLQNESK